MSFKFGKASLANRDGVDERLIEIDDLALQISLVDFGHGQYSGLRTVGDQQHLHATGKSPNCDGIIVRSKHQDGLALDSYAFVDGKASWKRVHLMAVAAAHLEAACRLGYKIRWGGFWKSSSHIEDGIPYGWDCPHIELLGD